MYVFIYTNEDGDRMEQSKNYILGSSIFFYSLIIFLPLIFLLFSYLINETKIRYAIYLDETKTKEKKQKTET